MQQTPGSSASRPPSARVKRKFEDVEQGEVPTAGPTAVQQAPVIAQGLPRNTAAVPTAGSEEAPASVQGLSLSLPPGDGRDALPSCTCCYHSGILGHLKTGHLQVLCKEQPCQTAKRSSGSLFEVMLCTCSIYRSKCPRGCASAY